MGSLGILGGPVVDHKELSGMFDFSLQWTLERNVSPSAGADPEVDAAGSTLLEALKNQSGLKLKPINSPIQILVIDHVEQPSPN
jgi:bla regulator protein blaR1